MAQKYELYHILTTDRLKELLKSYSKKCELSQENNELETFLLIAFLLHIYEAHKLILLQVF